jgi:hydrophobic/amphiphilic exporter-1 (mainly G- bacteria), HAE1 family
MVALMVVVLGSVSLYRLRIDLLPSVEVPTLSVSTNYNGADPEVIERLVSQMLEEIINTVPGVVELRSVSSEGRSDITVTFAWGTDLNSAAADVRARLEEELSELPEDVDRPQIRKFDVASYPVVILGIASSELDPVEMNELVERQVRYRFARLPGVAQVDLWGGYSREIRVELDGEKVKALGLSMLEVIDRIKNANVDIPIGSNEDGRLEITLRAPAELESLQEIKDLVLDVRQGASIKLGQVANIKDTYSKLNRLVRVEGDLGIRVAIRKEANANTVEVSRMILEEIKATNIALPQVHILPVSNQGNFIERSIANVANSVLYGGSLAVLILLFFLRSVRSTVIIAIAIPLSILCTFALIYGAGLSLNMMTLGGLALGVGMMVDSSIVVLENIYRHRDEQGQSIFEASKKGSSEVAGAILASTITTLVIFLPLAFLQGVTGMLFGELALVVVFSLLASLLVSLTLVPMLTSRWMSIGSSENKNSGGWQGLVAAAEQGFIALENGYRDILDISLRHRWFVVMACFVALGLSCLLWPRIGSEFMPPSDEGEVRIKGEFETGLRLDLADELSRQLENIVFDHSPERQSAVTSVVASGSRGNAAASVDITLNVGSSGQRERSNTDIANELRSRCEGQIPGAKISIRAPQGQFLLERLLGGDSGLVIEVRGFDFDQLEKLSTEIQTAIAKIEGITSIEDDLDERSPQQNIRIDRAKVADCGLDPKDLAEVLEIAVGGRPAGDYRPEGFSIPLRVQLANSEKLSLEDLLQQEIKTPSGAYVALSNLVHTTSGFGPSKISRKDQQRTVSIKIDTSDRSTGSIAKDIMVSLEAIPVPTGYDVRIVGSYKEQEKAFGELLASFALALLLVYMVLACQYESLKDPFVVMFAVPVSAIGVLLALYLTDSTMNLQSGIGCIMLGGIVVNNAILLVDQAGQLRQEGMATVLAICEAGRRRLRPILMTTATTILGLIPLAFGIGEGADAQAPLARVVVGGLCASTLITLFLVPALYTWFHPDRPTTATP